MPFPRSPASPRPGAWLALRVALCRQPSVAATAGGRMDDAMGDETMCEAGTFTVAREYAARRDDHAPATGAEVCGAVDARDNATGADGRAPSMMHLRCTTAIPPLGVAHRERRGLGRSLLAAREHHFLSASWNDKATYR
jgi:hypothetical protein